MEKLIDLEADLKKTKELIKVVKKDQHNIFYKDNRSMFRLMDLMVVMVIIFNFGAMLSTVIMNELPEMVATRDAGKVDRILEANPIQSEISGFIAPKDVAKNPEELERYNIEILRMLRALLFFVVFWLIMLSVYIFISSNVYQRYEMYLMVFVVLVYFFAYGYDFINNLGLLISFLVVYI
jgi:hypothetical protein